MLRGGSQGRLSAEALGELLIVRRSTGLEERVLLANFGPRPVAYERLPVDVPVLDESETRWSDEQRRQLAAASSPN